MKVELIKVEAPKAAVEFTGNSLTIGKRYVYLGTNGTSPTPGTGFSALAVGEEVIAYVLGYVVSIKTGGMYSANGTARFGTPERHKQPDPEPETLVQITVTPLQAMQLAHGAYYQGTFSQEETGNTLRNLLDAEGYDAFEQDRIDP